MRAQEIRKRAAPGLQRVGRCSLLGLVGRVADIDAEIQQPLLRVVAPDGAVVELVTLTDGRCAILRDGVALQMCAGDADSVDRAVQDFMRLSREPLQ